MRIWIAALIAMMVLTPAQTRADESGKACVSDGKTLVINGKRWRGACRGGVVVELNGIVTPPLEQLCDTADGRKWYCGRAAAAMLLEYTKDRVVDCMGDALKKNGPVIGACFVNGENINGKMVTEGWALADRDKGLSYVQAEMNARKARKGLWQGGVTQPW